MQHNAVGRILGIGVNRASAQAGWLEAVVAAHGKVEPLCVGIRAAFDLTYAPPVNSRRIVVLFAAGHLTAMATDALRHVEVESILRVSGAPAEDGREVCIVLSNPVFEWQRHAKRPPFVKKQDILVRFVTAG
jgi:hypothetical protein